MMTDLSTEAPSSQRKEASPTDVIQDNPDWTVGDFALVSSDGWRYRVRAAALCWVRYVAGSRNHADGSAVLNDAVEASSVSPSTSVPFTREIRFAGPFIETSAVLERFLLFVMKGALPKWEDTFTECETMCRVVSFMRKDDCEVSLSFLKLDIKEKYRTGRIVPFFLFMLAAAMDDVDRSILAFRSSGIYYGVHRNHMREYSTNKGIPGMKDYKAAVALLSLSLDDGGDGIWPYELWQYIPSDYLWAASTLWAKKWASMTAKEAVDAANTKAAEQFAEESARQAKRPRKGAPASSNWTRFGLYRLLYTGHSVRLSEEYEAMIKAVKNIST